VEVLISVAETPDTEWLEKQVGEMIEPFRRMALPNEVDSGEEEEQNRRLSRVLSRVRG
jgi:hypothetical protein